MCLLLLVFTLQRPIVIHPSEHGPGALMAFIFELAMDGNVDGNEPEPGPEESLSLRVEEESEPEEANGSLRATTAEGAEGAVAEAASVALH